MSFLWILSLLLAVLLQHGLRSDHAAVSFLLILVVLGSSAFEIFSFFYITIDWCYFTGSYVSIHSSGFRDFLLKPELLRAIVDCGFEHPSEVQHECIPQAILSMDVLCQAKSGMGKTAVFVLATLQQLEPVSMQITSFISH